MNLLMRRATVITTALVLLAGVTTAGAYEGGVLTSSKPAASWQVAPAKNAVTPLDNNCSGGYVTLTFDGGPVTGPQGGGTPLVLATLQKLHLKAVFFVIGTEVTRNPEIVRAEVADGDLVENHTWDHEDLTGYSTGGKPATMAQVTEYLEKGAAAIVKAGAPAPTLWRPPFDDVTAADNAVAASLGERVVMSVGDVGSKITDSQDWRAKYTGAEIAKKIIYGSVNQGEPIAGLQNGTIVGYHDGLAVDVSTPAAYSLQPIVTYMNAHHLCSTTNVPNPADGGAFNPNANWGNAVMPAPGT